VIFKGHSSYRTSDHLQSDELLTIGFSGEKPTHFESSGVQPPVRQSYLSSQREFLKDTYLQFVFPTAFLQCQLSLAGGRKFFEDSELILLRACLP
jgi:hypothetical protein